MTNLRLGRHIVNMRASFVQCLPMTWLKYNLLESILDNVIWIALMIKRWLDGCICRGYIAA